jgi:hypothetical protein
MSRSVPSAFALVLACAATLAACGGSSPSASSAGSAGGSAAGTAAGGRNSAAFAKFRDCLKAQGVDVPPGRPGGGDNGYGPPPAGGQPQQTPEQQKAMQACAKYRPQGAAPGGAGRQNAAAFTPYLTCLKAQGLNVDVKAGFNALRGIKRDDPKLQPALKACASKLPQRPQGAPGASSTTPGTT